MIRKHRLIVTLRWMPSHLKEDADLPIGISILDVQGNAHADHHAGIAARTHRIDLNVAATHIYYYHLVKKIQRRLVDIVMNLPHRSKQPHASVHIPQNFY